MGANLVGVTTKRRLTDDGTSSASVVPPLGNLQPDEFANNQLYEENKPSVVFVEKLGRRTSKGMGFIWDTKGHIVTNYHVIHDACNIRVTLADETEYDAKVLGSFQDKDVAVLCIDAPKEKLRPVKVGISSNLLIGQKVYAIGHPFGLDHTLTTGVFSGPRREIHLANGRHIQDAIQTDASINPGNSGGPLLDSSGYLIGIIPAICSQIRVSNGAGYAIPVDTVKGIVEQIVKFGKVTIPISADSGSSARPSKRVRGARTNP